MLLFFESFEFDLSSECLMSVDYLDDSFLYSLLVLSMFSTEIIPAFLLLLIFSISSFLSSL